VIQARLRDRLGIPNLPGNAFMQHPTIRELAAEIERSKDSAAGHGVTKAALERFLANVRGRLCKCRLSACLLCLLCLLAGF
jgi:hypothetical protein